MALFRPETNICLRTGVARKNRINAFQYQAEENGAGEGIRTLDPNLGKVVLYP